MKATGRVQTSISSQEIKPLFKLSSSKIPPVLWGLTGCLTEDQSQRIVQWYANESLQTAPNRLQTLVANLTDDSAAIELSDAVEALAIGYLWAVGESDRQTIGLAGEPSEQALEKLSAAALRSDSICELQTKSIGLELGMVLAFARNDSKSIIQMGLIDEFEAIIDSNLDSDGWPGARLLSQIGALAGCWSRIVAMLKKLELELDGSVQIQLEWLTRQCLRLMRPDGSLSFASDIGDDAVVNNAVVSNAVGESQAAVAFDQVFWQSVMSMSSDPDDAVVFRMLMDGGNSKKQKSKKGVSKKGKKSKLTPLMANELVDPFNVSEWSDSFLLRSTWNPKSPRVAVDFSYRDSQAVGEPVAEQCFTQISRSVSLIHGQTLPEIIVDDQALQLSSGFEVVCERHDNDVDYVEIEAELSNGSSLNRQWLLSRSEEFLLVADYVLPASALKIEYRCRWPLAVGMTTMQESETREVYLQTAGSSDQPQRIKALALPLALPEWKAEKFSGQLVAEADALVLEQRFDGDALYAPLLFDLNPGRSLKKRTWRKLTVAQDRQIVADDQAMAFRFQLNKRQWFFYRALASQGNRTFLGENVNAEFAFNRLHKSGKVSPLFVIE